MLSMPIQPKLSMKGTTKQKTSEFKLLTDTSYLKLPWYIQARLLSAKWSFLRGFRYKKDRIYSVIWNSEQCIKVSCSSTQF